MAEESEKKQQKQNTEQEQVKAKAKPDKKWNKKKKKEEKEQEENRNAGPTEHLLPTDIYDIDFTLSEEKLRLAALGPQYDWAANTPQEIDQGYRLEVDIDCDCDEKLYSDTKSAILKINSFPGWGTMKHSSDHLVAFLKGTDTQMFLGGQKDVGLSIQKGLDILAEKGLPHLQNEVAGLQTEFSKRSGKIPIQHTCRVEFGISTDKGPMWETDAKFGEITWSIWDLGDSPPLASWRNRPY